MKCGERIAARNVQALFKEFWALNSHDKRMYISGLLELTYKNAHRPIFDDTNKSRYKQISITYTIHINEEKVPICKADFLKCFGITNKFIEVIVAKKRSTVGGIVEKRREGDFSFMEQNT